MNAVTIKITVDNEREKKKKGSELYTNRMCIKYHNYFEVFQADMSTTWWCLYKFVNFIIMESL